MGKTQTGGIRFVTDEKGNKFAVINGNHYPCKTLEYWQTFTDGKEGMERFQKELDKTREEYIQKSHASYLALKDKILR